MQLRRNSGVALVTALATLLILAAIGALLFGRTVSEMRHSRDDAAIVQTLLLARGAANAGGEILGTSVRSDLKDIVQATADTTSAWAYGDSSTGASEPDPASTARDLEAVASRLQTVVDNLICNNPPVPDGVNASVSLRIYFTSTACGQPLPNGVQLGDGRFVSGQPRGGSGASYTQVYALPFVMVADAQEGNYRRNVVTQGEFRFTLGRSSFARYALFTNVHALPDGTNVWFTDRTLFDGPVHTNNIFRFYHQPWFGGEVTSAGCLNPGDTSCGGPTRYGARFFGSGFVRDTAMSPSPQAPSYTNIYGTHAPQFMNGVDWRSAFIALPNNNNAQRQAAQNAGIYIDRDVLSLNLSVSKSGGTKYQNIDVTTCSFYNYWGFCLAASTEHYRYSSGGYLQKLDSNGDWKNVIRNGSPVVFNGVIFADGGISRVGGPMRTIPTDPDSAAPAIADFAKITIAASDDVYIRTDLKYEDPPCSSPPTRNPDGTVTPAVCNNLNAKNVLGIYSQNGNIFIGQDAPPDIYIDAVLMSARGVVQVENYDRIPPKGSVYLTGGIIEYYYGAFGTFNSATGTNRTGYGRRFTYDQRMAAGLAPPFFPTTQLDTVTSISVFSFGQREQVF
ncbi:DUF4900 domain-containing protein [Oceanithermus sp.]